MNKLLKKSGLSARRRTINNGKNIFWRDSFWVFIIVSSLILSSCHEKTNGQISTENKNHSSISKDSLDKPKVNIKVNKHYDDKGNVIGFDSTYTSYYSNVKGDTTQMDSLMNSFNRYFSKNHSSFFQNGFDPLFFNDSLRYPDFFHNDFFMKRYELNDRYLRGMMHSMDSIKNQFYEQHSKKGKNSSDL